MEWQELARSADVVHVQTRVASPWAHRDYCIARCWFTLRDGTCVGMLAPSTHPSCPAAGADGHVRGQWSGAFAVQPLSAGACVEGQRQCLVSVLYDVDVAAAYVPRFVKNGLNAAAQLAHASALAGLRETCAFREASAACMD